MPHLWLSQGDDERLSYEIVPNPTAGARGGRIFRYAAICGAAFVLLSLAADRVIDSLLQGTDAAPDQTATNGVVDLSQLAPQSGPYVNEPTCPDDGRICICTKNFVVTGKDSFGNNIIKPRAGGSACQPWLFQVGDMIFMEKPAGNQRKYRQANIVAKFTGTPVVHVAIVMRVPPLGVEQTGENVIALEALKGQWKKVLQNSIRTLVERYPFGGVSVRRVDPARYPDFFMPDATSRITLWAQQVTGEPFDVDMVNPARKRLFTKDRFISEDPWCADRERADKMYVAGGPHKWICTQLVAWTIAFAGKLNLNPANLTPGCDVPEWVVQNLQPGPGDFLTAPFVQPGSWRAPCQEVGCYIGVPNTARWTGGTTALPTAGPVLSKDGSGEAISSPAHTKKKNTQDDQRRKDSAKTD